MSTVPPVLTLLRHGQRVRPEYEVMPGETEGAMGASTAEQRPDRQISGIVKRFNKAEAAYFDPQALGWIKAVYQDALEYTGLTKELQGLAFAGGLFYAVCALIGVAGFYYFIPPSLIGGDVALWVFAVLLSTACGTFATYILTFGIRMTVGQPQDLPIIFDRKHRKVYRILREQPPGFKGMFMPWPIKACEYEWDLVDVEHNAEVFTTGGSVMRNHYLMFAVRKSKDDATIIDSFQIANASALSEELVPCMWEHIRRFMQERGPHLPTHDEPLASHEPPPTWWDSCGAVGVFGSQWAEKWRTQPFTTLLFHVLFPIFLPMNLIWGTGNWLFYKTAVAVQWPAEVTQAVGRARAVG
jgi:hypothetical protein